MSVKLINFVPFCHINDKLPVAFWQRVTYTHPTGFIPTPIIPYYWKVKPPEYSEYSAVPAIKRKKITRFLKELVSKLDVQNRNTFT